MESLACFRDSNSTGRTTRTYAVGRGKSVGVCIGEMRAGIRDL
jgi:hypothetical protein